MNLFRSITGVVDVELTSAELERILGSCNAAGITLHRMQRASELTCILQISRKDFKRMEDLCKKRGTTLRILRKRGLYWAFSRLWKRPVFMAGILLLLAAVFYFPTRVFFVQVEGNNTVAKNRILEAAEECGICFGASRREIRSEKVKNALLSAVPQLQWVGINTAGCVATISVRERVMTEDADQSKQVTNIVASRDGYILSGTVTQGNPVFRIGQTVKAGQILVSGYTDCGICIRAERSRGEIFAETIREITAVLPSEYRQRTEIQGIRKKISLIVRKKRINLWKDSGISDSSCGRMYKEYYITLPGGFRLPIALCVESYEIYDSDASEISQEAAENILHGFAQKYLLQQMVAGEIIKNEQSVIQEEGRYRLRGTYVCTEMIGREQQEQIGDTNGKSS